MELHTRYGQRIVALGVLFCCISLVSSADDCLPGAGRSGDQASATLIIQTWETRTSNFHTSAPEMMSAHSYTVPKSSKVSLVGGVNVRFYGDEICVAVTKAIEREKSDGAVDRSTVCEKDCFGAGSGTRITTYDGSGGRITSTDPPCCLWGRRTELHFSIPAPPTTPPAAYECLSCTGCGDKVVTTRTETCNAGEKCYTLKLQKKKTDSVTVVKGCSHILRYWGEKLNCDYKCKSNVPLYKKNSDYHYSVCVSCCEGNKCNAKGATGGARGPGPYFCVTIATVVLTTHALITSW